MPVHMQHPGSEVRMKKTKHPGVSRLPDGRYVVRVKTKDPRTGRAREAKHIIQAHSAANAAQRREELRQELACNEAEVQGPLNLGTYGVAWMNSKLNELASSTAKRYATALDLHILPELGGTYIHALTQADLVRWRDKKRDVDPETINGWLRILKTLLADACAELGLSLNPATRIRALPSGPANEGNCLSRSELPLVLQAIRKVSNDWYPLFATLAMTGMRFGEASALRWEDLSEDYITIRRAQCRGVVGKTKTGKTRVVPLLPELDEILRSHRRMLMASQAPGFDNGYVFPSKNGKLLHGPSARKPLIKALRDAGIYRRFTPHGFRHTFNNLVRQQASGEVLRAMTGHSTERMSEHYSHVDLSEKKAAAGRAFASLQLSSHHQSGSSGGSCQMPRKNRQEGDS